MNIQSDVAAVARDVDILMTPRRGGALDDELLASCRALAALASQRSGASADNTDMLGPTRAMLLDFVRRRGDDRRAPQLGKKELTTENQIMVVARAIRLWDGVPAPIVARRDEAVHGLPISVAVFKSGRRANGIDKYVKTFAAELIAFANVEAGSEPTRGGSNIAAPENDSGEADPGALSPTWSRIKAMSDRLTADIDGVGSSDNPAETLSGGAYVERTVEASMVDRLRLRVPRPEVVIGEAGDGKTTMLWSLHRKLARDAQPVLISAVWFQPDEHGHRLLTTEMVIAAITGVPDVVVLLDTADLLLHNQVTRDETIALIDRLRDAGVPAVVATRPREAETLPENLGHTTTLGAYNDSELAVAIPKLVGTYCADGRALPPNPVAAVLDARARGVLVDRVCSSPLLLRMLFELAAPDFPGLEIDVTGLYHQYWDQRVIDDLRIRNQTRSNWRSEDLSTEAGMVAITMVAAGRPELPLETVVRRVGEVSTYAARRFDQSSIRVAIEKLCRRGVLNEAGGSVRFLHQTLFEFAAAQGIAERGSERELSRLLERLEGFPDDLFLGAVVEQLLILLATDPLARDAVADAVGRLCAGGNPTLVEIAMLVWAHHPDLPGVTAETMDHAHDHAIARFVRVIPSVRTSASAVIEHLAWVWDEKPALRGKIVDTCAYLVHRDPEIVTTFIEAHDVFADLVANRSEMLRANTSPAVLLDHMLGHRPDYARVAVIDLLSGLASDGKGRGTVARVLRLTAAQWPRVGSAAFLHEIESAIGIIQSDSGDSDAKAVREALAQVIAAHWSTSMHQLALSDQHAVWDQHVAELCESLEHIPVRSRASVPNRTPPARETAVPQTRRSGDQDPVLGARLIAVARLLAEWPSDDPRIDSALRKLFGLQGPAAGRQLARGSVAHLLRVDSPATDRVITILRNLLTGHLPADHQTSEPGPQLWAAITRSCLMDSRIAPARVLEVIEDAEKTVRDPEAFWTRRDMMVALAPAAIAAGHGQAVAIYTRIAEGRAAIDPAAINIFLDNAIERAQLAPGVLGPMMIRLARNVGRSATVRLLTMEEGTRAAVEKDSGLITEWIETLLEGQNNEQGDGARLLLELVKTEVIRPDFDRLLSWFRRLRHPEAKADVLKAAGALALRTDENVRAVAVLRKLITATRYPTPVITLRLDAVVRLPVILDAVRDSLLESLGFLREPDPEDWNLVFTLAFAPRLSGTMQVDMRGMGNLSLYLTHLADTGHCRDACTNLLEVVATLTPMSTRMARRGSNQLRVAIGTIVRTASTEDLNRLINQCASAPEAFATQVIRASVRERYGDSEDSLQRLALHPALTPIVNAAFVDRVRTAGNSTFPEMLHPVPLQ
ncbi:NACHT domain-containing protein [Mycobacteroides abscessus]|uniref:NACHT domain-containing protein n=1 Tax=Mycobacteroides abscessus TaxID=36809 RepID=UPI000929EFDC|nr:hypothetical protein [Mycobacteroides abscessus]SIM78775.1 Uncharacterised protein [Mycobacteroides abscessus subsp. abscessus]